MYPEVKTTSIARSGVGDATRGFLVALEDMFSKPPLDSVSINLGIDQVVLALISVHSDDQKNASLADKHRGVRRFVHPRTGQAMRSLAVPIVVNPDDVSLVEESVMIRVVADRLLIAIDQMLLTAPLNGDLPRLGEVLRNAALTLRYG